MTKRAFPLLYIYQPKEIEVEAENQLFVYHKWKNEEESVEEQVEELLGSNEQEYEVNLAKIQEGILMEDQLQLLQQNQGNKLDLKVADAVYTGTVSVEGNLVFCQTEANPDQRLEFNLDQVESVKMSEN